MNKTVKSLVAGLLAVLLLAGCGQSASTAPTTPTWEETQAPSTAPQPTQAPETLTHRQVTFYVGGQEETLTLSFAAGQEEIPLICVDTAAELLQRLLRQRRDEGYTLEVRTQDQQITLVRENGAGCRLDFAAGTLCFDDYNRFNRFSYELGSLDILDSKGVDLEGQPAYFQRVIASEKPGKPSVVDFAQRQIPFLMEQGKGYMTLQTFSDLFLTPQEWMVAYNQEAAFLLDGTLFGTLDKTYFAAQPKEMSPALGALNYRQLCLLLDFHYGLADSHAMESADGYLTQLGLKEALSGTDSQASFTALKTLIYNYLSDNHSRVLFHSPYNPQPNYALSGTEASVGYWEFYKNYQLFAQNRKARTEQGLTPYREIGNTAFVTIDSFSSATVDYYQQSPLEGDYQDELGLICYAHNRINRPGSPIEQVVIDLSANAGGHMDGGIFLTSWVLGNGIIHISDPIRDAEGTFLYRADVNLDRKFDEQDVLTGKTVYVLTSPVTFSCANYVAAALKESGKVNLVGTTTGGGSGCVYMATTADGAAFALSSGLCMSGYKNGSYYSIDAGIEPDIKLTRFADFFDQRAIKELLDQLP